MPYRDLVDAAPAREHVQYLLDVGMSVAQIQYASGVNRTAIRVMLGDFPGRRPSAQIRAGTEQRLMRVRANRGSSIGGIVPAAGTLRRLHALVAMGYPLRDLSRLLGRSHHLIQMGRNGTVLASEAQAVMALYDELSDTPGPSSRSREYARYRGWLAPAWWDDDAIDDPLYEPEGLRTYRPVSVQRMTDGHRGRYHEQELIDDVTLPRPERVELLTRRGFTDEEIAQRIGTSVRYVKRDRLEYSR